MSSKRSDQQLQNRVEEALAREPLLGDCRVDAGRAGPLRGAVVLFPEGYCGHIAVEVDGGVVTLQGQVPRSSDRRLAARIARALPGCQAVVDRLEGPPDPDSAASARRPRGA